MTDVAYKQEQKQFFQDESFEEVFGAVQSFHQLLLSGIDVRAVENAKDFNLDCAKNLNADSMVRGFKDFNGGVTEVPKGEFACLSDAWVHHADALLDETLDRLGVKLVSKEAREWIKKYQIYPVYVQETQNHLDQKFEEEKKLWSEKVNSISQKIEKSEDLEKAITDFSPSLRHDFPHLPIEVYLTELYQKQRSPSSVKAVVK